MYGRESKRFMSRKFWASLSGLVLVLSGCSLGAASSEMETITEQTQSASVPAADSAGEGPRQLRGMGTVPDLGDPVPVAQAPAPQLPVTVKDADNKDVTITDTSRIVTLDLSGSISRTVIGLGLENTIVGRSASDTASGLAGVPVVTREGHAVNSEAILAQSPSLVMTDGSLRGSEGELATLRASGITVLKVKHAHSFDGAPDRVREVATALGVPGVGETLAVQTAQSIRDAKEQIAQWTPADPMSGIFLNIRAQAGVFSILGSSSGVTDLIEALGMKDMAAANGITQAVPASQEALLAADPEVIFVMVKGLESFGGLEALLAQPGLAETTAGKHQRIIQIPDNQSLSFGPQAGEMLLETAKVVYGK
ncbi:hypothetical protein HMPREF9233_00321 [Actinobaculum massiliense ACS-171-V-Col2]|uniref:Fe/B12 periplasmic-binding domain-containing protein n=2 Tax=Actinobaculum TaxID=76833 RepID=K9EE72_9ACTO|nr:hypothetical protein HMPREF9233_00321 [Actinobaculum massiliense ACS-171-V-Col2]